MAGLIYLADACALIVFLATENPERLMPNAARIMREAQIVVLPITIWEISQKAAAGKLPQIWGGWPSLPALLRDQRYEEQPFTWDDAQHAASLPPHHKDPIDRMLIAVALRTDLPIITSDGIFAAYGVRTVW